MSGHPKVQETFARVMGYVEQFDVHSPNVRRSLRYLIVTPPYCPAVMLRQAVPADPVETTFVVARLYSHLKCSLRMSGPTWEETALCAAVRATD